MGLDFIGSNAHFSYSGFYSFRAKLAESIGIPNLRDMEGFDGDISWDTVKDDISLLINHSDCDGNLSPAKMKKIYPRLKAIAETWNDDISWDKERSFQLADDMERLVKQKKYLKFC